VNYFQDSVEEQIRVRDDRRRRMIASIRGWLREKRSPRLILVATLALCAVLAIGVGCSLAGLGIQGWGTRAFWSVLAVWPVFVLLVRWRAAIDFAQMDLGNRDQMDRFIAAGELTSRELYACESDRPMSETERAIRDGLRHGSVEQRQIDPFSLLLLGALTLGFWLIWDLTRTGVVLLADTIFDAEVVPPRFDLITSVTHLDWRMEALGFTAFYFPALALCAGCVGHLLTYLIGR
jgi:hypothetical protein